MCLGALLPPPRHVDVAGDNVDLARYRLRITDPLDIELQRADDRVVGNVQLGQCPASQKEHEKLL